MNSPMLDAFTALKNTHPNAMTLYGDSILVEEVKPEEVKSKGGIILSVSSKIEQMDGIEANRPIYVRVLATGEGFYDDENPEKDVPLSVKPGDICLVGRLSVGWLSSFLGIASDSKHLLGITREAEVKIKLEGQEGYETARTFLSEKINAQASTDTSK